jgi:Hydantoinase/oxoprolinase
VEAVSVCFLFSYLNPSHERRAAAIVREEYPGCFVCASSDVAPQFREFERFTTAAMNAFVGPKVRRYISRLSEEFTSRGLAGDLRIMRSNGGIATAATDRCASGCHHQKKQTYPAKQFDRRRKIAYWRTTRCGSTGAGLTPYARCVQATG